MYRGFTRPPERFGLVLVAILVAVIFQLAAPDTEATRLVSILLQTMVLVLALFAAGADRGIMLAAGSVAALFSAVAAVILLGIGDVNPEIPRLTVLVLVLLTPAVVIVGLHRELRRDQGYVRFQTIFAALCLYLLLGLLGGFAFAVIQDLGNEPFFTNGLSGSPNELLYYSFTTLTTTGYGDFAAATDLGRAASITEALFGQIYLVTVIAVLVGNLRRRPA
jgi:hypothetical protein